MDQVPVILVFMGVAVMALSWIYMIIVAFKDDYSWGLCSVFLPPVGYFYGLFSWSKSWEFELMAVIGFLMTASGLWGLLA